jgi:hypothetical protein
MKNLLNSVPKTIAAGMLLEGSDKAGYPEDIFLPGEAKPPIPPGAPIKSRGYGVPRSPFSLRSGPFQLAKF